MSIEQLRNIIPDYAKDIKLNLSNILTEEGALDLNQKQIFIVALGVANALRNPFLVQAILAETKEFLSETEILAAKSAASIMAMNNIYYRSTHLIQDKSFATMPAKLRMNIIANPGIDKICFELACLAISAINGCGLCLDAHTNTLVKAGVSKLGIQSSIRIAAVLNAVVTSLETA